jgi:hypothetical protein
MDPAGLTPTGLGIPVDYMPILAIFAVLLTVTPSALPQMFAIPLGSHELYCIRERIQAANSSSTVSSTPTRPSPATRYRAQSKAVPRSYSHQANPSPPIETTRPAPTPSATSHPLCMRTSLLNLSISNGNSPSPRILDALQHCLAPSTMAGYGSAVSRFLTFCDSAAIPACERLPASEKLLADYAASFARSTSGSTAAGAVAAIKTWHTIQGVPWQGGPRLALILRGVANLAPASSKREPRPGVTTEMLMQLHDGLDRANPRDLAVYAAATVAFWGQCRLGELLGTSRIKHDPARFPSRGSIVTRLEVGSSTVIHLPFTKTAGTRGQDIVIPHQIGQIDPIYALARHIHSSKDIPRSAHIFAFRLDPSSPIRCLTKEVFLNRCNEIWSSVGLGRFTGHSFRIGGTNAFMDGGVETDIVKAKGRWKSDAFLTYWRNKNRLAAAHIECIPTSVGPARTDAPRRRG